jgi:hypothetical protein
MMNISADRRKIIEEIEQIPEDKLSVVYRMVHDYRIEHEESKLGDDSATNHFMEFAGAWEDMSDEELNEFLEEIRQWRRSAFDSRRERCDRYSLIPIFFHIS